MRDLDIDLIDRINPFDAAYAVLAKAMDERSLRLARRLWPAAGKTDTDWAMRTGGQIVVDHLLAEGVRHVFIVPGESFLGLLTALHAEQRLRPGTARHESAAAMMAEATGKLTGRPGVAVVTSGPGAANALAGVYIASQDQLPMVLLVGLPPRTRSGAPAFQQIDLGGVFGSIAKSVTIAENSDSLSQLLAHAFHMAVSGRPGPVVLGLPEDVLHERAQTAQPIQLQTKCERHYTGVLNWHIVAPLTGSSGQARVACWLD